MNQLVEDPGKENEQGTSTFITWTFISVGNMFQSYFFSNAVETNTRSTRSQENETGIDLDQRMKSQGLIEQLPGVPVVPVNTSKDVYGNIVFDPSTIDLGDESQSLELPDTQFPLDWNQLPKAPNTEKAFSIPTTAADKHTAMNKSVNRQSPKLTITQVRARRKEGDKRSQDEELARDAQLRKELLQEYEVQQEQNLEIAKQSGQDRILNEERAIAFRIHDEFASGSSFASQRGISIFSI